MFNAVIDGARRPELSDVEVVARPALVCSATEALEADGFVIGGPANLGYLAGAVKHFFDQIYYPCLDATRGRPFGCYLHGNSDTTGAARAIETITTGLGWRRVAADVSVIGQPKKNDLDECWNLGATVAAMVAEGT